MAMIVKAVGLYTIKFNLAEKRSSSGGWGQRERCPLSFLEEVWDIGNFVVIFVKFLTKD